MNPRTLLIIALVSAVILGAIAFAPIPNNPLSLPHLSRMLGFGRQKESERNLMEERKEKAKGEAEERFEDIKQDQKILMENEKDRTQHFKDLLEQRSVEPSVEPSELRKKQEELKNERDLQITNMRDKLDDLRQDQKILMENRKDQVEQSKDSSLQQLIDPVELRQKAQQPAELVQQQKDRLKEKQQTEEERQKELKSQQERQMMDMRQKIKDQRDMMQDRMNKW